MYRNVNFKYRRIQNVKFRYKYRREHESLYECECGLRGRNVRGRERGYVAKSVNISKDVNTTTNASMNTNVGAKVAKS